MVSMLGSGLSGLDSSPGDRGRCVVFLGKTLYSHSVSDPSPQVYKCQPINQRDKPAFDQHPMLTLSYFNHATETGIKSGGVDQFG